MVVVYKSITLILSLFCRHSLHNNKGHQTQISVHLNAKHMIYLRRCQFTLQVNLEQAIIDLEIVVLNPGGGGLTNLYFKVGVYRPKRSSPDLMSEQKK